MQNLYLSIAIFFSLLSFSNKVKSQYLEENVKLTPQDVGSYSYFGSSLSVSDSTIIIGAKADRKDGISSGSVYLYEKSKLGNWQQVSKLYASDGSNYDNFGCSVSITGNYAIIGAKDVDKYGTSSGAAYIFEKDSMGFWQEVKKLYAFDAAQQDYFGTSVSIDGNYAIVGAHGDDDQGSFSGAAYIFERTSTGWELKQKISGKVSGSSFGISTSISGDLVAIGAYLYDEGASSTGAVFIYEKDSSGQWLEKQKIYASDRSSGDYFGTSVSISGSKIIIGADGDDNSLGYSVGSAYIFEQTSTGFWQEVQKLTANDGIENDYFGKSVDIFGDYAIVGAYGQYNNGDYAGASYIFRKEENNSWRQFYKLIASNGNSTDYFGKSVSIYNGTALVGAELDDDNGGDSGSAYIFEFIDKVPPSLSITSSTNSPTSTTSIDVSINFSEEVRGFEITDIGLSNARISSLTTNDSINFIAVLHPISEGRMTVDVEVNVAYDLASNGNQAATQLIIDYQPTNFLYESHLLTSPVRASYDRYGRSVDIYQNFAIAGAPMQSVITKDGTVKKEAGKVYLYEQSSQGKWHLQEELFASDMPSYAHFGTSVNVIDKYAIIGASGYWSRSGSAYIFEKDSLGNWIEVQKLIASDRTTESMFGYSVAISEKYAIVGSNLKDEIPLGSSESYSNVGAAYIYERTEEGKWVEVQKLFDPELFPTDVFGTSVGIAGDYAVVGAPGSVLEGNKLYGGSAGAAYIYKRQNDGKWSMVQRITASKREGGAEFGNSICIFKNYILVGSKGDSFDKGGNNKLYGAGAAYVFKLDENGHWNEIQKLVASDRDKSQYFGSSVSLASKHLIIRGNDSYLFELDTPNQWIETKKLISSNPKTESANGVSISNNNVIVGYPLADDYDIGIWNSGAACIFEIGASNVPPAYSTSIDQPLITKMSQDSLSFTIYQAQKGIYYHYNISSESGNNAVAGRGKILDSEEKVTGINVSSLSDGLLTLSIDFYNEDSTIMVSNSDQVTKNTISPLAIISQDSLFNIKITFDTVITDFDLEDIYIENGSAKSLYTQDSISFEATLFILDTGIVSINIPANAAYSKSGLPNLPSKAFSFRYRGENLLISKNQTFSIFENLTYHAEIGMMKVIKKHHTNVLDKWLITAGNIDSVFSIDQKSGIIRVAQKYRIDYENINKYTLVITVSNGDYTSDPETLTIFIKDIDEVMPKPTFSLHQFDSINGFYDLEINFEESVTDFSLSDIQIVNASVDYLITEDSVTYSVQVTPYTDGAVIVNIPGKSVFDLAGNTNLRGGYYISHDLQRPTVTWGELYNDSAGYKLPIYFSESVNFFYKSDIEVSNGQVKNIFTSDSINFIATVIPDGEGEVSLYVSENVAEDWSGKGNEASDVFTFIFDIQLPTIAISSNILNITNQQNIPVTINFSEQVFGLNTDDFLVQNGTIQNLSTSDSIQFRAVVLPQEEGKISLKVLPNAVADKAGNVNQESENYVFTFDSTKPNVSITSSDSIANEGNVQVSIQFSESIEGFSIDHVLVGGGAITNLNTLDSITFTGEVQPLRDGLISIEIPNGVIKDLAGNTNSQSQVYHIIFDTTSPSMSFYSDEEDTTDLASFDVTMMFDERVSGFINEKVEITNAEILGMTTDDSLSFTTTIKPVLPGLVSLNVPVGTVYDLAGNSNQMGEPFSIIYDPSGEQDTINHPVEPDSISADVIHKIQVTINMSYDTPIPQYKATLYQVQNGTFTETKSYELTETATFSFDSIPEGMYTIGIQPSTNSILPTYLGNKSLLNKAKLIELQQDVVQYITLFSRPAFQSEGTSVITGALLQSQDAENGRIVNNSSELSGEVLANVSVYLINQDTKEVIGYDITGINGNFIFSDLEPGNYLFIADYKGLPNDEVQNLIEVSAESETISITVIAGKNIRITEIQTENRVTAIVDKNNIQQEIIYYPNPVVNDIQLELPYFWIGGEIRISDISGKLLYTQEIHSNDIKLHLDQMNSGVYLITVSKADKHYSFKIQKQ